ncbi:hypothetical protein EDF38_1291 [Frigoribacterium sp. PhB160]|uniref:helix-turn-helix domain-containing protein n=1 Tax=Frigoribacterium sp. PhB160 TaxID=2485192 RepID=UPI000F4A76DB|nr:helix-turn-helix domain-containing protein [Frigoribacterium sp. PhB160]ROS62188.1 hypothetical protein EDF38_1291 [Frigoribacterium sp. PhB160]
MTELDTMTTPTDEDLLQLAAARARRRLLEAPALVGYVRALMVPGLGGAQDGMPRAASKTAPLPMRADAVDDTDDIFARLTYWVNYWSTAYKVAPPSAVLVHWARDGEAAGFRAETTPAGAQALLTQVTTWLLIRHDLIALHADGPVFFDDVNEMLRSLWAKYPTAPRAARGVLDRACPVCDRFAFGAHWPDDADVDGFELSCSFCGHSQPAADFIRAGRVRELMHELREEHADPRSEWWTKRQAMLELDLGKSTLNRYIADGDLQTYTVQGTVYVNTEDLLTLWRAKRTSTKETRAVGA